MLQEFIDPVALVATALFAGFIGKYSARWVLQIYHHLRILDRERYLTFYDKFRSQQAFSLLSQISDSLPDNYNDYLSLHQENRRLAYRMHLGYLLVLLARALLFVCILAGGCFMALGQYHPGWLYLLSMATVLLPTVYGILYATIKEKRGGKFYRLAAMGVVLTKMHKRSANCPEI